MNERETFDYWLDGLSDSQKEYPPESLLWLAWKSAREADPLVTYTTAPVEYDYRNCTSETDVNAGLTTERKRVRKLRHPDEYSANFQRDCYRRGNHEVWTVVEYRRACMDGKMNSFKSA